MVAARGYHLLALVAEFTRQFAWGDLRLQVPDFGVLALLSIVAILAVASALCLRALLRNQRKVRSLERLSDDTVFIAEDGRIVEVYGPTPARSGQAVGESVEALLTDWFSKDSGKIAEALTQFRDQGNRLRSSARRT